MKFLTCAALAAVAVSLCPPASADPIDPYCFDERLCSDLSDSYYCPGMPGRVGPFASCDALVTGPYAPGGLVPNEGIQGNG